MKTNAIYCGDNLEVLSKFPDKSVDLIYADPPFFSNRNYEVIWNDGTEIKAFEDRWKGGIDSYINWMIVRLAQCHKVLKDTGSMYLHCDWHANAHLRIQMDRIFGEGNFQNEIIWHYGLGGSSPRRWQRKHDNILFYSRTDNWQFTPFMVQATSQRMKGQNKKESDVWDIPSINNMAIERIGYPTQKPEALLKRIIEASSNKDDIVLDPFCGCGTTIAVAQQLGRQWIGIDVSPTACRMMKDRLNKIGTSVELINMPATIEELKAMNPFDFQAWVINKMGGTHSNKKTDDGGIDGWTFMNREPIQIKQQESVGRPEMQKFQSAIRATKKTRGYFYAFSFSKGAIGEVARASREDGITIELMDIQSLTQ